MKTTIDNLDKTYQLCMTTGSIREKSTDVELIQSLKPVAEKGLEFIMSECHSCFRHEWFKRLSWHSEHAQEPLAIFFYGFFVMPLVLSDPGELFTSGS